MSVFWYYRSTIGIKNHESMHSKTNFSEITFKILQFFARKKNSLLNTISQFFACFARTSFFESLLDLQSIKFIVYLMICAFHMW